MTAGAGGAMAAAVSPQQPVLVGQGGHRWGGAGGGAPQQRWPARHKFSKKRLRQRSEKLQPVPHAAHTAAGARSGIGGGGGGMGTTTSSEMVVEEEEELGDVEDGGNLDIDQAW
jgi:hypothetical protein